MFIMEVDRYLTHGNISVNDQSKYIWNNISIKIIIINDIIMCKSVPYQYMMHNMLELL